MRGLRDPQPGDGPWTRSILIATPGVLVILAVGAVYASPFRNAATAVAFWLLMAFVLVPAVAPRRR